ncbi:MAG: hypothetical protein FWC70_07150 [Defluviitaleaceae bacterium]|nr:hypothetical protein [Defluviitaleaceae bacterium]
MIYAILSVLLVLVLGVIVFIMSAGNITAVFIVCGIAYIFAILRGIARNRPRTAVLAPDGSYVPGPKPLHDVAFMLSLLAAVALVLWIFPFPPISGILGVVIVILTHVAIIGLSILVFIMCSRKKRTHNVKPPRVIAIIVLVIYVIVLIATFFAALIG